MASVLAVPLFHRLYHKRDCEGRDHFIVTSRTSLSGDGKSISGDVSPGCRPFSDVSRHKRQRTCLSFNTILQSSAEKGRIARRLGRSRQWEARAGATGLTGPRKARISFLKEFSRLPYAWVWPPVLGLNVRLGEGGLNDVERSRFRQGFILIRHQ